MHVTRVKRPLTVLEIWNALVCIHNFKSFVSVLWCIIEHVIVGAWSRFVV